MLLAQDPISPSIVVSAHATLLEDCTCSSLRVLSSAHKSVHLPPTLLRAHARYSVRREETAHLSLSSLAKTTHNAPKRMFTDNSKEIPLLGEFKHSLDNDPIFRDHFNAFLQLPVRQSHALHTQKHYYKIHCIQVFPQRFLYEHSKGVFEPLPNPQSTLLVI